ncbi:MAG TPA: cupredoxin family protein [Rubrivivax sp.]|nr:cupredoxin family protein [Rubrivivax sp.]
MDRRRRQLLLAASSALLGNSGLARAHGDEDHPKSASPVKKEQKDWGIAGDAKAVKRTVEVRMLDTMRFTPDRIDVRLGETLRFRVQNTGKVMHEFVIGTQAENAKHAALMLKFPNMEHDEPYMAHVPPGKTGEIVWTFNRAGTFEFACLIAGHYQAGMVGTIGVGAA